MIAVQFLGPSGVGKSFLYQRLFKRKTAESYMNVKRAYIKAALNIKLPMLSRFSFYQLLLGSGVFQSRSFGLAATILKKSISSSKDVDISYKVTLATLTNYLSREVDVSIVEKRFSNFENKLFEYTVLEKNLESQDLVVFDEGPLHHHHGLSRTALGTFSEDDIRHDVVLHPNGVISCEMKAEEVFERALQRRDSGVVTFSHNGLNKNELRDYVFKNVLEYQEKVECLALLGVPILRIDTAEDLDRNLASIDTFLTQYVHVSVGTSNN